MFSEKDFERLWFPYRCKTQRICEIIRGRYQCNFLNGDIYMFMSNDQRKVRMIH